MRRDVRAVERAERCLERAAAGIRSGVLGRIGMAADAAARLRQIFAAPRIALGLGARSDEQKKKPRHRGARAQRQALLLLAEILVTAAARLADGADLRLPRVLVARATHFVELV